MPTSFSRLRFISGLLLMIGACTPLAALDDLGPDEQGGTVGVWLEAQLSSSFSLADVRKEWDESQRMELGFRATMPAEGAGIPFIHCGLFYEDRTWEAEDQRVDLEAFGLAVYGGMELRVLGRQGGRGGGRLALGVVPWARFGIASQHAIVDNVIDADLEDVLNGSFNVGRIDGAAGVDVRVTLMRRLVVELGVGAEFWRSANVTVVATNIGSAIAVANSINFYGHGTFARLGAAISF